MEWEKIEWMIVVKATKTTTTTHEQKKMSNDKQPLIFSWIFFILIVKLCCHRIRLSDDVTHIALITARVVKVNCWTWMSARALAYVDHSATFHEWIWCGADRMKWKLRAGGWALFGRRRQKWNENNFLQYFRSILSGKIPFLVLNSFFLFPESRKKNSGSRRAIQNVGHLRHFGGKKIIRLSRIKHVHLPFINKYDWNQFLVTHILQRLSCPIHRCENLHAFLFYMVHSRLGRSCGAMNYSITAYDELVETPHLPKWVIVIGVFVNGASESCHQTISEWTDFNGEWRWILSTVVVEWVDNTHQLKIWTSVKMLWLGQPKYALKKWR